jgi:RND family efflux transporter MFP subunit
VPERAAAQIRVGQAVQIRVDGDPRVYPARVSRISPLIDQTNRTLLVEAEAPNQRGLLRPGAFVRAEIVAQANQPAVFVPAAAIVTFAGLEKVITVENGKTVEKEVRTGRKEDNRVEITEGIEAGEKVVVRPGTLVGGMPVEIVSR